MTEDYNAGFDYAVSALLDVLNDVKVSHGKAFIEGVDALNFAIKIVKAQAADIKTGLNS